MQAAHDEVANGSEDLAVIEINVATIGKADEAFGRSYETVKTLRERDRNRLIIISVKDQHRRGHSADVPVEWN